MTAPEDVVTAYVPIGDRLQELATLAESLGLIVDWDDADLVGNPKLDVTGTTEQVVRFLVDRMR